MVAGASALALAGQHPLYPVALPAALWVAWVLWVWRPAQVLFWVPALLPVASLMPWTGWWLWDEFDLLMLGVLSALYARTAWDRWQTPAPPRGGPATPWTLRAFDLAVLGLALSLGVGVWRALAEQPGWWTALLSQSFYGDYDQPGQTWRVAKATVWALAWWPWLRAQVRPSGVPVAERLAWGMVAGLSLVVLWVVWERATYPGWLDFSSGYRTTAGFWEMHVGGGAIDAYLALALPFAAWALWRAPSPGRWWLAALLVLGLTYAVLTTFSRGLYGVALGVCVLLWAGTRWRGTRGGPRPRWLRRSERLLLVFVVSQAVLVWGLGSFMGERLTATDRDAVSRWTHWARAWNLPQNAVDHGLGLGWGRWTAHYSAAPGGARVGQVVWQPEVGAVRLSGPAGPGQWGGHFGLTQRVPLPSQGAYRVSFLAHGDRPVWLLFSLCEQHLLYPMACQWRTAVSLPAAAVSSASLASSTAHEAGWHELALHGAPLGRTPGQARPRAGVLAVSVLTPGAQVQLQGLALLGSDGVPLSRNPGFHDGLQHWMPLARQHFQPWHADNAYLDVWVERGALGLLALAGLVLAAGGAVACGLARREPLALVWGSALVAVLALGAVISFTELPRVSFMVMSVFLTSVAFATNRPTPGRCNMAH